MKKVGSFLTSKFIWWLLGLIGTPALLIIAGIFLMIILLIGISGGGSAEQAKAEEAVGNGIYYCSPQQEINEDLWTGIFDDPSRSGKLHGYGEKIIELSEEKGIDPVLFASISLHETGWGKSNAIESYNNPGGLMGANGLMQFDTLDEGLESMARTLYNRIIVDGLVTIEQLGAVYAPIGADNDPHNLNSYWVPTTETIVSQLGGLTMNCDLLNELDFDFDNQNVSELRANIAGVGTRHIGKSLYVFGGGRNQADINRGHFDCSSFVHWAYNQNGINLGNVTSTSTETLNKLGKRIDIGDIKIGDLIFWDTYKKDGHVGIYVGNNQFIGAQSSTGVAIESLSSSYWSSVFSGHVRRIIED